jgi:homogentisate 1,2-dioxygenase
MSAEETSAEETPEKRAVGSVQVARYRAFAETAGGFTLPSAQSSDRHFFFSLPGAVAVPAVLYFRTRHFGKPAFSVRVNDFRATQYTFVDGDEAERTWHEVIPATTAAGPTLRPDNNELVFFARDGSVVFGDVVILYTSNQTTIPVVLQPTG